MDLNFDHQMSLSKSKCLYSNNCIHFLKRAVPFIKGLLRLVWFTEGFYNWNIGWGDHMSLSYEISYPSCQ
jgi:hypothetical protein